VGSASPVLLLLLRLLLLLLQVPLCEVSGGA
jgi:hypothetical protein